MIGLFSLRVRAIFFAMITLAVASAFAMLASQLSGSPAARTASPSSVPGAAAAGHQLFGRPCSASRSTAACSTYYLVFVAAPALFLVLLRIVNSPFGRVLQAIRENEFRAEAIGYRTVVYRTLCQRASPRWSRRWPACCSRSGCATPGRTRRCRFEIMLDILLMVVIGGMGTMYGAVVGAALFVLAQNYLQDLMSSASTAAGEAGVPLLPQLLHPDRWLLWLGVLFVASVYFFPTGIVGKLRGGSG